MGIILDLAAWLSLHNLDTDGRENIASSNSSVVVSHVRCRGNLFTEPLPSDGRLFWLNNSGLHPLCHNIILPPTSFVFLVASFLLAFPPKPCMQSPYIHIFQKENETEEDLGVCDKTNLETFKIQNQ
jgi:hypothetical protein